MVVQHEAVATLALDRVDDLRVPGGAQRGHHQRLGLTASEQRRTMGPRQHPDARGDRAHGASIAPVDACLSIEDPGAHQPLLETRERLAHLAFVPFRFRVSGHQSLDHRAAHLGHPRLALELGGDPVSLLDALGTKRFDPSGERFVVNRRLPFPARLASFGDHFLDCADHRLCLLVPEQHRIEHHLLGQFPGFGLDHQHRALGTRHHQVEL